MIPSVKSMRLGVLAVAAAFAFGACTTAATTAPTAAPAASSAATAAPTAASGALPSPEQTKVSIGLSVTEMSQYAGVLAKQLGIYEKNGLDVDYTVFEGDGRAVAALQADQIDISFTGTSSAISSQLTDVPFVIIGVMAAQLTDDLVCQGPIKTADDVKGKTIAISTFGGTSNAAALLSLKALNLAANDAVITQVGGQSARIAALVGGSIDCAIVDSNMEADMTAQGFSIAAKLKEAGIEYGRSGIGVRKDWLAANRNTALVVLASVLEAQNMIFDDPASVVPHYAEFAQIEAAKAEPLVADFGKVGNRAMMWTDEAFKNPQKAIAVVNPDIIDVNLADAYDRTLLEELVSNGFYEKIGAPVPS
ncbi:MAG: ABC transporter substrate-binding protein [Chloroflexota bacterium]